VVVGVVALLGAVFVVSATSKVRGGRAFAASLRGLRLLPSPWVRSVASAVTVSEVVSAGGLAVAGTLLVARSAGHGITLAALAVAGVLLLVLTSGIALALRRGTGGRCACFGASERPLGRRHLVRNGLLLVAAVVGIAGLGDGQPVRVVGALIAVCAGAIAAVVLIHLDELVDLFASSPMAASTSSTSSTSIRR